MSVNHTTNKHQNTNSTPLLEDKYIEYKNINGKHIYKGPK